MSYLAQQGRGIPSLPLGRGAGTVDLLGLPPDSPVEGLPQARPGQTGSQSRQENETLEQTRARVERATVELTEQHWAEISAVAGGLFAESWLAGDDIDLIADAVVEGYDWVSKLAEYRVRRDVVNNLPKP